MRCEEANALEHFLEVPYLECGYVTIYITYIYGMERVIIEDQLSIKKVI